MKKISKLILLFSFIVSFQISKENTGKFEYEQIENRNNGFKSHVAYYDLEISKKFSCYKQVYKQDIDEKYTEENSEGVNDIIIVKPKKDEMKIVFNDFERNLVFFKDIVAFDKVFVKEDKYEMKWILTDEIKKFGKRECKKATTTFRGRTYTAWYLPDIQTKVGPWKFINPPGLIFEIYDNDYVLHIKLQKFNTNKLSNINLWDLEKVKNIISIEEYIILKKKAEDVILERLNSKLPKGSKPFVKNKEQKEIEIFN